MKGRIITDNDKNDLPMFGGRTIDTKSDIDSTIPSYIDIPDNVSLRFFQVKVANDLNDNKPVTVVALQDSGCSGIMMSIEFLKASLKTNHFDIVTSSSITLSTALLEGGATIVGWMYAYIIFQDKYKRDYPIYAKIFLASGLAYSMFIGRNIMTSENFVKLTKDGLYMRNQDESRNQHRGDKMVFIPYHDVKTKRKEYLVTTAVTLLPRNTMCKVRVYNPFGYIQGHTSFIVYDLDDAKDKKKTPYKAYHGTYQPKEARTLYIAIANDSHEDILLRPNERVAIAETIPNEHITTAMLHCDIKKYQHKGRGKSKRHKTIQIDSFRLTDFKPAPLTDEDDATTVLSNAVHFYPRSSSSNDKLNRDFHEQLEKKGYYQYSPSETFDNMEEARSYEPFENTKRLSYEEIFKLLQVDHLTENQQELLKDLLKDYRDVFAANLNEISRTHLVQLGAELKQDVDLERLAVKHKDTPIHLREETEKILQQMIDASLVRISPQQVRLVTPVKLVPKKDKKKWRMVQDTRITNSVIVSIPDTGSDTIMLSLARLGSSDLITMMDLTSAYWQIEVTEYLASLLCFQGPDRRTYQSLTCPMGLKNSSSCLAQAVTMMRQIPVLDKEMSKLFPMHLYNRSKQLTEDDIDELQRPRTTKVVGILHSTEDMEIPTNPPVYYTNLSRRKLRKCRKIDFRQESNLITYADDITFATRLEGTNCCNNIKLPELETEVPKDIHLMKRVRYSPNKTEVTTDNRIPDEVFQHHLAEIEVLLRKLKKANLKVSPQKTLFATKHVNVLGVAWRPGKISLEQTRLRALEEIPTPKTPRQIRGLLATLSYWRNFIPRFSHHAQPIMKLAKTTNRTCHWKPIHEQARRNIMKALRENMTRNIYDPKLPVVISTDASDVCAAGVIDQIKDGQLIPIASFSRTFTNAERNASIFRKELLSLLYGLASHEHIFKANPNVHVITDSRAIMYMKFAKDSCPFIARLSATLSEYDIKSITSVPSLINLPADQLSRLTADKQAFKDEISAIPPMTPFEAETLCHRMVIEKGRVFKGKELKDLLEGKSPLSCFIPTKVSRKTPQSKGKLDYKPRTMAPRNIRPPQLVDRSQISVESPWMLPKYKKKQLAHVNRELREAKQQLQKLQRQYFALTRPPDKTKQAQRRHRNVHGHHGNKEKGQPNQHDTVQANAVTRSMTKPEKENRSTKTTNSERKKAKNRARRQETRFKKQQKQDKKRKKKEEKQTTTATDKKKLINIPLLKHWRKMKISYHYSKITILPQKIPLT